MAVLEDLGAHHLRTGDVILYTSADSVLQLAAHHDVLSEPDLLAACAAARAVMTGEHAVGRVIARPFTGRARGLHPHDGAQGLLRPAPRARRTSTRCRRPASPSTRSARSATSSPASASTRAHPGATNAQALAATGRLRRRARAPASCSRTSSRPTSSTAIATTPPASPARWTEIDAAVGGWLERLGPDDLLVLTADHGVDPTMPHHDHTREHAPLLARFAGDGGRRHDGPLADVGASALDWLAGRDDPGLPGTSFVR